MALFGLFGKKQQQPEQPIPTTPREYFADKLKWQKLPMAGGQTLELSPESGYTAFPEPTGTLRLIYESERKFIEETYYWILHFMRYSGLGRVPELTKVLDTFQGSVQSSAFGQQASRQAIQQDRAGQYLRVIAEMSKQLHQLVREMRIIDERLSYYNDTFSRSDAQSADIALKGLWVDMVEGGTKNPASVYGMAQNLSFVILPDLFFATSLNGAKRSSDVSEIGMDKLNLIDYEKRTAANLKRIDGLVDALETNKKVKEVLKRKLYQFYTWKYRTYRELKQRRSFTIKYLRQHHSTIRLYAEWVKPYLQNVIRLSGSQRTQNQPELVAGFETSALELEVIGKTGKKEGLHNAVVSVHLRFVTTPQFSYTTPDYQNRGPQHSGRMEITLRTYGLTDKEYDLYRELRAQEPLDYVKAYDKGIAEMLDAIGDDLAEYLKEEGEDLETPREKERREAKAKLDEDREKAKANPFFLITDTYEGFKELFGAFGVQNLLKQDHPDERHAEKDRVAAAKTAHQTIFNVYNYYKKSHQFMTP